MSDRNNPKRINIRRNPVFWLSALAFLLPVTVMLIVFVIDGIYPFGDRSFLCTDLYHQYMPFFTEFVRSVKSGQGISYTWNIGVGSNFLALYVYYLASPFHWLGLLVPESHIMEFLTYLVVAKTGACGWSAFWFFCSRESGKHIGKTDTYRLGMALFFSLGYALSGFMAAYNWNIMWLDCVILLPFILRGLELLVRDGKPGMYCVALALSILTNYYISIMICIFLVLYFIYLFCIHKKMAAVWHFALYSLLAGGMAAVLLIPEVCAILATDFGDISFPKTVETYFSVLDMLARHCVAVSVEKGLDHWPNIYCGVSAFLFVPLYALNEKISAGKRFGMLALAGFILLGFNTSVLNFIWHGLNYPDSLPGRQSFIYILLILTMCYDGAMETDFSKPEKKERVIHVYLGVAVAMLFVEKFAEHEDVQYGVEWLTLLFVTIYAAAFYLLHLYHGKTVRKLLLFFMVAMMVTETCINTGITSVSNVSRSAYLEGLEDYGQLYQWSREQEDGFYRIEKFKRTTKNDGALTGYPTASVFSSTMNSAVMDLYERLGMRHSKVYYCFDGSTAFTSALLNVHYMFADSKEYGNEIYSQVQGSGDVFLYRAEKQLPFGYVAPVGYDVPEGFENSPLRLQNQMVYDLGIEDRLFEDCDRENGGDDIHFTAEKQGIYYGQITAGGTKKVKLFGSNPNEMEWNDLKDGAVLYIGQLDAGDLVTITNNDKEDESKNAAANVYYLNQEVLDSALELLSEQHLEQVAYDSTHISGVLNLEKEGRLILSVPCEKGWTVRINGEETEPELFGGTFMAFDLQPGRYEIKMHYVPYGLYAGIGVSLAAGICFVGLMLAGTGRRKKREKEEQKKGPEIQSDRD